VGAGVLGCLAGRGPRGSGQRGVVSWRVGADRLVFFSVQSSVGQAGVLSGVCYL
jgi:hypothetical protein